MLSARLLVGHLHPHLATLETQHQLGANFVLAPVGDSEGTGLSTNPRTGVWLARVRAFLLQPKHHRLGARGEPKSPRDSVIGGIAEDDGGADKDLLGRFEFEGHGSLVFQDDRDGQRGDNAGGRLRPCLLKQVVEERAGEVDQHRVTRPCCHQHLDANASPEASSDQNRVQQPGHKVERTTNGRATWADKH